MKGKNIDSYRHVMGKEMMKKLADIVQSVCETTNITPEEVLRKKGNVREIFSACADQDMGLFEIGLAVSYTLDLMEKGGLRLSADKKNKTTIH
jgi:hypothetical protein